MPFFKEVYNKQKKSIWAFTTYFAEGFPYTIIRTISSFFFRDQGMSLEGLGVTSVFGLPWVLKFLWGPQVDAFGTKRKWLLLTEAMLCCILVITVILASLPQTIKIIVALFFLASFIAATHDIAIDGYYMEALDKGDQAKYLGYRVMAYRIAMMTGTGVIATVGAVYSWPLAFSIATITLTTLFIVHVTILPKCEHEIKPISPPSLTFLKSHSLKVIIIALLIILIRYLLQSPFFISLQAGFPILKKLTFPALVGLFLFIALIGVWFLRHKIHRHITRNRESFYARSFISFMDREKIGFILAFIIFIRTGEYMLSAMYSPFMIDLGLKAHYGWISAGVGLPCSIAGAILGGWCIARYGLAKMIWPFLALQNVTNLIYMLLALKLTSIIEINTANPTPDPLTAFQLASVAAVHAFDQLSGGLGTAVLMTFLMRICLDDFKASHYAIGTGLMSVSGLYAGVISGFLTAWIGYGLFFGVSFLFSIPGMVFVFFVPLGENSTEGSNCLKA